MKVFITGPTGFIGSNLAMKLAESGHTIHALYRTSQKKSIIQHKDIKIFKGDILDRKSTRGIGILRHFSEYRNRENNRMAQGGDII